MDRKLSFKEYILLASMLFGLFFGAGNLIFPPPWASRPAPIYGRPSRAFV